MSSLLRFADARTLILFDAPPTGAAVVIDAKATPPSEAVAVSVLVETPPHAAACGCCAGRTPASLALDSLFQARVRGSVPWFDRVVVMGGAAAAVRAALVEDPLTRARFRST